MTHALPTIAPRPVWVKPFDASPQASEFHVWLRDDRYRVAARLEHYQRIIWATGDDFSDGQHGIYEWDPREATPVLHGLWHWRHGVRRDLLREGAPEVRDPTGGSGETRRSIAVHTKVEAGDFLEVELTEDRIAENDGERTRVVDRQSSSMSTAHSNFELRWERSRTLLVTELEGARSPVVTDEANTRIYRRTSEHVPAHRLSQVVFTDWQSWKEVRAYAEKCFDVPVGGERFEACVEMLRALPEDTRLAAAIRLVRDEVRSETPMESYDESSQPRAPEAVLTTGRGNSFDKSALLVSLLRALGVTAWPALAPMKMTQQTPSFDMMCGAFVRLDLPSGHRFVDATWNADGNLSQMNQVLVIAPGVDALSALVTTP